MVSEMILMMGMRNEDDHDSDDGDVDRIHLEKVLHSEPTSMTRSPTTRPHSEQI